MRYRPWEPSMSQFNHASLRTQIEDLGASLSRNEVAPALVARAMVQGGAQLTADGAVSVRTGAFTGRSPKDKFIVRDALTQDRVWWDNSGAISPAQFDVLLADAMASLV